jgi:thymidylate kinase
MNDETPILVISGIDGSGKTSIIKGVQKALVGKGHKSRYIWLRYNHYLTKFLLAACRLAGLTRYEYFENSRVGYHDFHKSKFISWLFIILTFVDTLVISFYRVYIPSWLSNKIIVCDRWVFDIIIDLEVDTGIDFSKGTWLYKCFTLLHTDNCRCFIIKRGYEVVRKARDENINDKNFSKRFSLYEKYAKNSSVILVDNNESIEKAVEQIVSVISV